MNSSLSGLKTIIMTKNFFPLLKKNNMHISQYFTSLMKYTYQKIRCKTNKKFTLLL